MALVICTECGREVSDRAESCPGCGCPNDLILTNSNIESRRENFDVESFLKKNNIRHGAAMCRVANEFQYQIPSDIFKAKAIYEYAINNSSSCYSVELATDELNNIRRSNPELFDTIPENCDIDSHRSCQQLEYNRDYKSDCQNADGIAFMIQDFVIGAAIGGCMFYIWGFSGDQFKSYLLPLLACSIGVYLRYTFKRNKAIFATVAGVLLGFFAPLMYLLLK